MTKAVEWLRNWGWVVALTLSIIVLGLVFSLVFAEMQEDELIRERQLSTEYECLECGWQGYIHQMHRQSSGVPGLYYIYCPQCGAMLFHEHGGGPYEALDIVKEADNGPPQPLVITKEVS